MRTLVSPSPQPVVVIALPLAQREIAAPSAAQEQEEDQVSASFQDEAWSRLRRRLDQKLLGFGLHRF